MVPPVDGAIVLRDIQVNCGFGSGAALYLQFQPGNVNVLQWTPLTPGYTAYQWNGRIVIGPGFTAAFVVGTGTWTISCSGYTLTA